jgi:hypothetical protein
MKIKYLILTALISFLVLFLFSWLYSQDLNTYKNYSGAWQSYQVDDSLSLGNSGQYWSPMFRIYPYMTFNIETFGADSTDISRVKLYQSDEKDSTKAIYVTDLSWKSHTSKTGATAITAEGVYGATLDDFAVNGFGWLVFITGSDHAAINYAEIRATGWNTVPR